MKPVINPVPGAFVFLCTDGAYTEAPLFVGPFDCGFVRNPKGEGYLRLHYMGDTSVPGVTYSGVWGAVLAKAKLGNDTVVTPVEGKPAPQPGYPQADTGDAGKVRGSLSRVCHIARLCTVNPAVGVDNVLATSRRIDDLLYEARNARAACDRIIGSYQKKAKLGNDTVVTPSQKGECPQADTGDVAQLRKHVLRICGIARSCAARESAQPSDILAALNAIDDASFGARGLCNHIIGSYQKGE